LGAVFAGEAAEVEESPTRGFAANAGVFGGIEERGAYFLHADGAKKLHGSAALLSAEGILQGAGVDAGGLADVAEGKWKVGVGANVLLGVVELPRAGFAAAIEQARVIVGLSLEEELDEFVLKVAHRNGCVDAVLIGGAEDAAKLSTDDAEALSGGGFQKQCRRKHQLGMGFAVENFFQFGDYCRAGEADEESFESGGGEDFDGLQRRLQECVFGIDSYVVRLRAVQTDSRAEVKHEGKRVRRQARLNAQIAGGDHAGESRPLTFGDENLGGKWGRARQKLGDIRNRGVTQQRSRFIQIPCL